MTEMNRIHPLSERDRRGGRIDRVAQEVARLVREEDLMIGHDIDTRPRGDSEFAALLPSSSPPGLGGVAINTGRFDRILVVA